MGSEYTRTENSTGSYSSKKCKRGLEHDGSLEDEEYNEEKSAPTNLTKDDMLMFKDFIKTHSGEVNTISENR